MSGKGVSSWNYKSLIRNKYHNIIRKTTFRSLAFTLHKDEPLHSASYCNHSKLRFLLPYYSICRFHGYQAFRAPITPLSAGSDIPGNAHMRGHEAGLCPVIQGSVPLCPTITPTTIIPSAQTKTFRYRYVSFLPHRRLDIQFPTNHQ